MGGYGAILKSSRFNSAINSASDEPTGKRSFMRASNTGRACANDFGKSRPIGGDSLLWHAQRAIADVTSAHRRPARCFPRLAFIEFRFRSDWIELSRFRYWPTAHGSEIQKNGQSDHAPAGCWALTAECPVVRRGQTRTVPESSSARDSLWHSVFADSRGQSSSGGRLPGRENGQLRSECAPVRRPRFGAGNIGRQVRISLQQAGRL